MNPDQNKFICPDCKKVVELSEKPKQSFMGFLKVPCPNCRKEFLYPLSAVYVAIYWILLVGNAAWLLSILFRGELLIPNPIGIVVFIYVIISLVKNRGIKKRIAELQKTI